MPPSSLGPRERKALILTGIIIGAVLVPAAPAAVAVITNTFTDPVPQQNTVPYSANNNMTVKLKGTINTSSGNPFLADNRVDLNTTNGNATFVSNGAVNVTVDAGNGNLTGTWTNVTALNVTQNDLKIAPEDKPAVNVTGDTDRLSFRDATLDDDTPDIVYAGTTGSTTVTIRGLPADEHVAAIDINTNTVLATDTTNSNGVATFSGMPNSEHTVELQSSSNTPSLTDPQPQGPLSTDPSTLSVQVDDDDFPSDNVTVDFYIDGTKQGQDSTTTSDRVSLSVSNIAPGSHTAKASATDSYGNTRNITWTFSTPGHFTIRNASAPWPIADQHQITATFRTLDDNSTIRKRTTTTGSFDLAGLPTDEVLVVELTAANYQRSYYVLDNINTNETAYLINDTTTTVNVTFALLDRTGGTFRNNNPTLHIQTIVNVTGTPKWNTTQSKEFDGAGEVRPTLEKDEEYRLIIKNDQGDMRILGTYIADTDGAIEQLEVGQVIADPDRADTQFQYNATYTNNTTNTVSFEYNDSSTATDSVALVIYEHRNPSNVLFANSTFGGPLGTISVTETVPADEEDKSWVVKAVITRDGEQRVLRTIVGPRTSILTGMDNWLITIISLGSIWLVAGLFSRLNGDVGALVVASLGGLYWYVDFLPAGVGTGVVVLALILAGVIFANNRREAAGL